MQYYRHVLIIFVSFFYFSFSFAANYSGTYTIGATGDFTNLTALSNALKSASGNVVTGNCTFELKSDYSSSGESFPIVFGEFTGASSYTVTIRPQAGLVSVLTEGGSNQAVISLDGADNYIFDGRAGGVGSPIWTIRNTRTSNFGPTIRFLNGATYNTLSYLIVESQNANTYSGNIYFQGTTNTTGNSFNTLSYCQIRDRSDVSSATHNVGVYSNGNSSYPNASNVIDYCKFFNHFHNTSTTYGIYLNGGSTDFTITNNRIYQPSVKTYTGANMHAAIRINNNSGNNFTISNNTIGYASDSESGVYTMTSTAGIRFVGIYLSVGTTTTTNIQGNKIASFNLTSSHTTSYGYGIFTGVYISSGKVNIGNLTGNIVGDSSSTGNISLTTTASTSNLVLVNGIAVSSNSDVNISNNVIAGFNQLNSVATTGLAFYGIYTAGTLGNFTINNNKIGSYGTANSIKIGTNSFSSGQGRPRGIYNRNTGTVNIENNMISNITNNCMGDNSTLAIYSISGLNAINGNLIRNISTYSVRPTSASAPSVGGIIKSSSESGVHRINDNRIYNLTAHHTSANNYITGIYLNGPSTPQSEMTGNTIQNLVASTSSTNAYIYGIYCNAGSALVDGNFVHSFSSALSPVNLIGIRINNGNYDFHNNHIRIGIDANGNSITSAVKIYGFYKSNSLASNFFHNSVYIGGTGVSSTANNTMAFYRSNNSTPDYVMNNIFVNNRSNATTGGKHYCYVLNGTNSMNIDYNIYYSNGTGGNVSSTNNGSTARQTLRDAREIILTQDLHSAYGDPGFINTTGSASVVNLNLSGTTPAEGAGISVSGIAIDFSGDTRVSLSPVDIGGDAGNFTANDLFTPNISYSVLSNTSSASSRTLSNVTITDVGIGVPVSGSTRPVIWYRISSSPSTAWVSNSGSLSSGNGNDGLWSFDLDYSKLSRSVISGDVIQYYIVAQDQASSPNIWYTPFVGANHSNVTSQTSAPTTPNSFTITSTTLSGTYTVGTGGNFTTLSGAGGFFAAANSSTIDGNITLQIISDITEPGTNALNQLTTSGPDYSVTIQPATATNYLISGSYNNGLIRLNGADNVHFDGRFTGSGNYLTFRNTNTGNGTGALDFYNGACDNTVQNCTLEGGASQYTIFFGTASATIGNNNNLIANNIIRDRSDVSSIPTYGIYSSGTGTSGLENAENTISNNKIFNFKSSGICLGSTGSGDDWVISDNHLYNNQSTPPSVNQYPIYIVSAVSDNLTITGNFVGGQDENCGGGYWENSGAVYFYGIYLSNLGSTVSSVIEENIISNIRLSNSGDATFCGIYQNNGSTIIGGANGNIIGSESTSSSVRIDGTGNVYSIRIDAGTAEILGNLMANVVQTGSAVGSHSGIYVNSANEFTISGNKVFKLGPNTDVTTSSILCGIRMNNSAAAAGHYIYNNMISLGQNSPSSSETIYGLRLNAGAGGNTEVFYNSIYIAGTASSSTYQSACINRNNSGNVSMQNNILFNARSGASSTNLGFYFSNTSGSIESDYNLLVSSNTSSLIRYNSTYYSLSGWKSATSRDVFSLDESTSNLIATNLFSSPTNGNLNIINDNPDCWYVNGNGLALTNVVTDFDGDARVNHYANGATDIGADEFDQLATNEPPVAVQSGTIAVGNTTTYTLGGRTIATIYWQSGSALPSSIDVQYHSGEYADLPSESPVFGHFIITQTGGTDFVYDLTLPFTDATVGLIPDPTFLSVAKSEDGVNWTDHEATVSYSARTVTIQDLNSFSYFNIISYGDLEGSTLPVVWLAVDAVAVDKEIEISWSTATETNASFFEVLKSEDGIHFESVGHVNANGNSNVISKYRFVDSQPFVGSNYYKIINHDFDGKFFESKIVYVHFDSKTIQVFSSENSLVLQSMQELTGMIEIYDLQGKLITNQVVNNQRNIEVGMKNYKNGVYLIRLTTLQKIWTFKIVK
ncbi:MAG: T9SS type A sorting domain-containing protein [Bacteroidales bacterium]|nr:T9SS type A sorting domain-containing protein [Bacteroidales bacterium]